MTVSCNGSSTTGRTLQRAGEKLIRALDDMGVEVRSAFWFFDSDGDEWRLVLSLPLVEREGSKAAYDIIQTALVKAHIKGLFLRQIDVEAPQDPLVSLIRRSVSTGLQELSAIPWTRALVGRAHIYRST